MSATVTFVDRYGTPMQAPLAKMSPVSFSHNAIGGPKAAELRADGELGDLYELVRYLKAGIKIVMDGVSAWWGYINEIKIYDGMLETTITLDSLYNRVAIAYELTAAGSETSTRMTTEYIEEPVSMLTYGRKELLATSRGTSTAHAEADRARLLEIHKNPQAFLGSSGMGAGEPYAVVYCLGLWQTLDWQYASVPLTLALAYPTIGNTDQTIGAGTASTNVMRMAQVFDNGPGTISLAAIGVYVKKVGNPVDNLTMALYTNPDDLTPGDNLASVSLAGAAIGTAYASQLFTLSSSVDLLPGTTYFLHATRSGDGDPNNYYSFRVDELQGYPQGPCRTYAGTAWTTRAFDMPYWLYADAIVPTSQQILSLLTSYGQFFNRIRVGTASGFDLESFRDGDSTAKDEIEHLLEIGTTNNRRYLATVDEGNNVLIYEEPEETEDVYSIDNKLNIYDPSGSPVEPWRCPVGVYMRNFHNVFGVNNIISGVNPHIFIDEFEYDIERKTVRITPRGMRRPEDELIRMANG